MVIDASALIAILVGEPEAEEFSRSISGDPKRLVSAFGARSCDRNPLSQSPFGIRELDLLINSAGATIVSFDANQVLLARSAYEKFGKGHHPAALNLGIAAAMHWPAPPVSRCCSRGMTSPRLMRRERKAPIVDGAALACAIKSLVSKDVVH